jgi:long-chain acyl-CoA synthetase
MAKAAGNKTTAKPKQSKTGAASADSAPKKTAKAEASKATASKASSGAKTAKVAAKPTAAKTQAKAASKPATPKAPSKAATPKAPAKATASKATAKATASKATAKPAAKPAAPKTSPKAAAPKETAAKTAASKAPAKAAAKSPAKKASPTKAKASAGAAPAGKSAAAKPWLQSYPPNVPAEIAPLADKSIGDLMVSACQKHGSRPAFTCMGKSISFTELEKASTQFGAWLQSKGLSKGARVALMMPNVLQYPIAMMGALRAGYTVVNVNPLYTPRELEHQLKDSGAEAIVILENFAKTLEAVVARTSVKHVVVATMGEMLGAVKGTIVNLVVRRVKKMVPAWSLPGHTPFKAALKAGAGMSLRKVEVGLEDIAFLQYTGGTTGVSKGAVLLHRNVLSNVAQNAAWVESAYTKKPKPQHPIYICALPLYHIYALTVNALMGVQQGAQNILIPNPRDIPGFVKELKNHRFNVFPGLNTLFNALLNNADFQKLDFKPLALTFGGGMAVQRAVAERWKKLTGIVISEGYGLSETSPVATANRFDAEEFTATIGLPIPSTEIAIRDEDGKDVASGEVGEICIRGPQVMAGYWNRPDETAKVMTRDAFFKSGDMGFMDEKGFVTIVDRKKDMILVSGFNVYPTEIEDVIAQHPGVLEVAAIGVPDEKSGEVPKVFIVRKDAALTDKDVLEFCKDKLTAYKRPRHVEFRSELPKTNVGKILRRELR